MEQNTNATQRQTKIPPMAWFLGAGLAAALIAVFVFNVALGAVAYYGFIALFIGSHFFMRGSHGGHGGSTGHQHGPVSNTIESDGSDTNQHSGHGCC